MILKGSQRAGGKQLALHLMRLDENDHIEVHEIRGFVANNVVNALREAYAVSRGTRCKQFLFSLSLSPPPTASVPVAAFEKAIADVEARLGLVGQPRVIVFHEKFGRRHAHCVWSRIDPKTLRAINLPHFKMKLREASRQLYLEHSWQMPRGFMDSQEADPLNFSLAEWQQAKRIERDPKAVKAMFQECWAVSDSLKAFTNALSARGYYLAQGDRRGFVAVDWRGEVYSLSRWTGANPKELSAKLGDPSALPTVEIASKEITEKLSSRLEVFRGDARLSFDAARLSLKRKRDDLVLRQRNERAFLREVHAARWAEESRFRSERFRKGLKGFWDLVTGRTKSIRALNEKEFEKCRLRDIDEHQRMIEVQLSERAQLHLQVQTALKRHEATEALLRRELDDLARDDGAAATEVPVIKARRKRGLSFQM